MANSIVQGLIALFSWIFPPSGTRRAVAVEPTPAAEPAPVNPWSLPWPGPSKEEAAEIFRRQAEATLELRAVTRERQRAAALATMGVDYPYTYEGAPFGTDAFATPAAVSA